jgi:hypothetical protein
MTVLAAEAAEGAGEGAATRTGASRRARRGRQQLRQRRVVRRTPIEGEMGGTQTETETYGPSRPGRAQQAARAYGAQAAEVGRRGQIVPGRPAHQGAILAEFLVCILVISLAPLATGGDGTGTGPSPYGVNDLKRLAALGAVFFGLALVPGDNGSKVAAWLGFLLLLIVLMNTLNTGKLKAVLDVFNPGGSQPPGATTTG